MKSERLKKLESELADLEQWLKLGLVPKKEIERHKEEIETIKARIDEEQHRLQLLKESGDVEEFSAPRRTPAKPVYADTSPTMSDIEINDETEGGGVDIETETMELDTDDDKEDSDSDDDRDEEDEEDPFSDRNRWRRGGIIDPDATEW